MKKYFGLYLIASILIFLPISCVNLGPVNKLSNSALVGIKKYNDIGWTFRKSCLETCFLSKIKELEFKEDESCNCDNFIKADNAVTAINSLLSGYFNSLSDLSDNNTGNYKFDDLAKALEEGNFGGIELKKEHVDAGKNILTKISKIATDGIKSRNLKNYMDKADPDVNILLTKLNFIISENLKGTLISQRRRQRIITDIFIADDKASNFEKRNIIISYVNNIKEIDDRISLLDAYSKTLTTIKDGHHKIATDKRKINSKELKTIISEYANQLQEVISQFNKFKK